MSLLAIVHSTVLPLFDITGIMQTTFSSSPGQLHFILGGCRSGKSIEAERFASATGRPVCYLATCRTDHLDSEMQQRILHHKNRRPPSWMTIENNFDLAAVARSSPGVTLLVDCLTLWLAHHMGSITSIDAVLAKLDNQLESLLKLDIVTVIVSNEVGMGIVPMGADVREWRDLVGWANQRVAQRAHSVSWMVAGIPLSIKG